MALMTKQEVFDTVANHLLTQMEKSTRKLPYASIERVVMGACAYRGDGGLKCAVGVLIPDEKYSIDMETISAYALCERFPEIAWILGSAGWEFADLLQDIHDNSNPESWFCCLQTLGLTHRLNTDVLEKYAIA